MRQINKKIECTWRRQYYFFLDLPLSLILAFSFFGKGAAMPYKPMSCHVGKHVHAAPLHQVWQHHIWATTTMASNWQPRVQISCSMKQNLMYFPCICFCDGQISLGGIDLQIYDMLQEDIGQWSTTSPPPHTHPKRLTDAQIPGKPTVPMWSYPMQIPVHSLHSQCKMPHSKFQAHPSTQTFDTWWQMHQPPLLSSV